MNVKIKRYKKNLSHTYAFGVFPTLELLEHKPQEVLKVILGSKGELNEGVKKIQSICKQNRIPIETDDRSINRLSPRENVYAVGVLSKYHLPLDSLADHLVLVNPSGMGNLGTIIRTMLGFGLRDLAIIKPAADIFDPRVIRASMGALFQLRFEHYNKFDDYRQSHQRNYYALMTNGKTPIVEATFISPFALIFGNESSGLGEEFHQFTSSIMIPHNQTIDSLNLAISVAIACYQASQ